jgi:hypothetical protein
VTSNLNNISFLDAIRPDQGWEVELALVTSYSSNLAVLVATMLALAGVDDEKGSGSRVDFASAYEKLRGKLKFLVQGGRLKMPKGKNRVLGIMDTFVTIITTNEKKWSWHPKVSFIKYSNSEHGLVEWRIWIGSRNLTKDCSWDLGILLVSHAGQDEVVIPGIVDLGASLVERSRLQGINTEKIKKELSSLSFSRPTGIKEVRKVELRRDGNNAGLPTPPENMRELIVVSPFIDPETIEKLGHWGGTGTRRILLSTFSSLMTIKDRKPTAGFDHLLFLAEPDPEEVEEDSESTVDNMEIITRGLHAKIICTKSTDGARMWIGSANATTRAWDGINTEAIMEMDIEESLYEQLRIFISNGNVFSQNGLSDDAGDPEKEFLEDIHKTISATWAAKLEIIGGNISLSNPAPFHPGIPGIEIEVGLITSVMVKCQPFEKHIPLLQVAESQYTEFISVRLSKGELQAEWIEMAAWDPPLTLDRDHRALAKYLTPRVFLEWIRSLLLSDYPGDGGGDWDYNNPPGEGQNNKAADIPWWAPTLEEVLRAWMRNPSSLTEIDRKLKIYEKYAAEHNENIGSEDIRIFEQFCAMWNIVSRELKKDSHV